MCDNDEDKHNAADSRVQRIVLIQDSPCRKYSILRKADAFEWAWSGTCFASFQTANPSPPSSMHADFGPLPSLAGRGNTTAPFSYLGNASVEGGYSGNYSDELWQACAGPLVSVPKQGDCVWYFPQGHMEQVAASTQQAVNQLPNSISLASEVYCRVVSCTLSAEPDTDEVFAQISLLPEEPVPEVDSSSDIVEDEHVDVQSSVRMFTKILTASDTSTHGGFSVLRKHAEDCLPPLDMSQDPPCQDLVATDLHGQEWKFRHTYRGHPRRHLLTTGWSVFVSNKRLVAGDAVIFLRGENGELRVGIRRAKRQQTIQPSVLSSDSMHMGVAATASYAIATRTIFSVFYKPRVNISAFLVPVQKYARAKAQSLSVGMRFKMKCEADDGSERSYSGTITGLGDMDTTNWPTSKWKSVIVNWDEMSIERPTRVSPWEVEQCASSPAINPSPIARSKRYRPTTPLASATDLPLPGLNKSPFECNFTPKFLRVVQGQEAWTPALGSIWRSSPRHSLELQHSQQLNGGSGACILPLSGMRMSFGTPFAPLVENELKKSAVLPKVPSIGASNGYGGGTDIKQMQGSSWSANDLNSGWRMPNFSSQAGLCGTPALQEKTLVTVNSPQVNVYPVACSLTALQGEMPEVVSPSPVVAENSCKLFGFSLTDVMPAVAVVKAAKMPPSVALPAKEDGITNFERNIPPLQPYNLAKDSESPRPSKSDAASEQEKPDLSISKEVDSRNQAVRSCTKVIKKGSMVGRGIDLSKIDSYKKLIDELESMFHMEGELTDPERGWQVAYSDSEGDYMHVGDDPWPEFCMMVRKIYILSPEEVHNAGLPDAGEAVVVKVWRDLCHHARICGCTDSIQRSGDDQLFLPDWIRTAAAVYIPLQEV
ncbi:hypothetical protein GOP47_0012135 [Adiantum capillus-veneris]|uniref:Auxin response factor n=1 Tax=Adiantum capillus-veneris TaxID=13818 RepID=A0A9D4UQM2_ADICA|nr:hypothetical protein GOP47_0012135 [Adiantum capillus-veneris]